MNEDGMFKIDKSGWDELHNLAELVIVTKTIVDKAGNEIDTPETLAAKALQDQIDAAREDGTQYLFFSEQEVQFLSIVVSKEV